MEILGRLQTIPILEPADWQAGTKDFDSINMGRLHAVRLILIAGAQAGDGAWIKLYGGATAGAKTTEIGFKYRVTGTDLGAASASLHPQSAEYVLPLRVNEEADLAERRRQEIAKVMSSDRCMVKRASAEGRATRSVDVRPFLCSIRWESGNLIVQHRTGGAGSIRVDEIMQLFGLQTQDLAGPVRRTNVMWETTELQNTSKEPCMETRAEDLEDAT